MILSMQNQAMVFLICVAVGGLLGFLYDNFRLFRKLFKHPNFLIQLEDILYWSFCIAIVFFVLLQKTQGEIRGFALFGVGIGMVLYFCSLSMLYIAVSISVFTFLKKVFLFILGILLAPFQLFWKIIRTPVFALRKYVLKQSRIGKKALHNTKNYAKMRRDTWAKQLKMMFKNI